MNGLVLIVLIGAILWALEKALRVMASASWTGLLIALCIVVGVVMLLASMVASVPVYF